MNSQVAEQTAEDETTPLNAIAKEKEPIKSCCGAQAASAAETYTLVGSYYSLRDGQDTILMFNNKGPQPLPVNPAFFSLSGERLELPTITIPATSYKEVDLRVLLANNLPQFEEGSLQVTHQGMRLQLGAQFKILKKGMLFDEQFITPATRFPSSRMESVWWMPSVQSDTKFILSNTTDAVVTATIKVDGTAPRQQDPAVIKLKPHETRVLDILRDLVGYQNGMLHRTGGISITHTGTPGAIIARMLVSEESTGYSSVVGFTDPTTPRSSKLNGGGLRLGSIDNDELTPIVVARNVGSEPTTVRGRVPYTNDNGDVVSINIPEIQLNSNEIGTLDVKRAIEQANISASVTFAGLELEYTTAPGSVVMNALSVSKSSKQVFQVPLLDPKRMPSSAGGFPWKVDGDYTTVIFIKNETDTPKKYVAQLVYEGGGYTLGIKELKPKQAVMLDFKSLRDNQTPDANGRRIPLNAERGQIGWTMLGKDNNTVSGRSEQVNTTIGISSTYACYNCCPDSIYTGDSFPTPGFVGVDVGDNQSYGFMANTTNCYNYESPAFLASGYNWTSSDALTAEIDYNSGYATAIEGGTAFITGYFDNVTWTGGTLACNSQTNTVSGSGEMAVRPTITSISPARGGVGSTTRVTIEGKGFTFSPTVNAGQGINVSIFSITGGRQIVADFTIAPDATGGNRLVTVVSGSGQRSNAVYFFVQIPTSLSVLSVTVLPTTATTDLDLSSCSTGVDFGISVAIKYQVNDQSSTPTPIKNVNMVPQETITAFYINNVHLPENEFPDYDDLGPSQVTGTSRTTDANGQFIDAPFGLCLDRAFTGSFVQDIRVLIDNTESSYHVRTNNFVFASTASGQGSVTNNSDIQKSRP